MRSASIRAGARVKALWAFLFACAILLIINGAAKSDSVPTYAAESNDGYVGAQACSACHQGIYQQFTRTSMGRSMSLVTPAFLQQSSLPSQYFNERLDRLFEVYSQDGKLYQSESATGTDGKESFRDVHQLEWIIGSGVNGFGGLLRKDGFLFQAPLSFYTHPMTWEPSPGYESIDLGFSRPITPGCIFCHSGRPNPVTGTNGQFDSTPFSQLAIGCESCHGPGAAHIQAMSGETLRRRQKLRRSMPVSSTQPVSLPTSRITFAWAVIRTAMRGSLSPGRPTRTSPWYSSRRDGLNSDGST